METGEESSKRVASEAKSPAGPPEGAVFEELFGRAKSSPPEAECPEGKKARAAGPERTMPGGQREMFQRKARAAGPKRATPGGRRKPGRMAHKNILS